MKRIFTAIDISDEARRRVFDYIENLRGAFPALRVGWERAEKLHLTLKFLGDASNEQIDKLAAAAEKIAAEIPPFDLEIAETGVFPSIQKARILWLGIIDRSGSLAALNQSLESACERIGFPREKRNFKPHLTVARLREPLKSMRLAEKHLSAEFSAVGFKVSELAIYQSKLLPAGSIYTGVATAKLGAGADSAN